MNQFRIENLINTPQSSLRLGPLNQELSWNAWQKKKFEQINMDVESNQKRMKDFKKIMPIPVAPKEKRLTLSKHLKDKFQQIQKKNDEAIVSLSQKLESIGQLSKDLETKLKDHVAKAALMISLSPRIAEITARSFDRFLDKQFKKLNSPIVPRVPSGNRKMLQTFTTGIRQRDSLRQRPIHIMNQK